jgi:hypothetical protein
LGTVDPLTRVQFPVPAPFVHWPQAAYPNRAPHFGHTSSLSETGPPQEGHSYSVLSSFLPHSGHTWPSEGSGFPHLGHILGLSTTSASGSSSGPSRSTLDASETSAANTENSVLQLAHLVSDGDTNLPQNGHSNRRSSKEVPHLGQDPSVPATVFPHWTQPRKNTGKDSSAMLLRCICGYLNRS